MSYKLTVFRNSNKKSLNRISKFLSNSSYSTIFHYPEFLAYHGSRFNNEAIYLAWEKGDEISAVMPAILDKQGEGFSLRSPYGASFGGIITKTTLKLKEAIKLVNVLVEFCESECIYNIVIIFAPQIYFPQINDGLFFALESVGYVLKSRDIFSVVDISSNYEQVWESYEGRARTAVRKAYPVFEILADAELEDFYPILLEDKSRLYAKPTHTLKELLRIKETFPERIWVDIAKHKETGAKAGICYFQVTDNVVMTFYMSQETAALKLNGINLLINYAINHAVNKGFNLFDFGGSTIGYKVENIGVSNFKESFGAISSSRLTYEWNKR